METRTKPSIVAVLEHFGADVSRVREYGKTPIHCPFHDDRSASGSVDIDRQSYHCYTGCQVRTEGDGPGDAYDLLILYEDDVKGFKDAKDWIDGHDVAGGDIEVRQIASGSREARPWRPPWASDDDD